VGKNNRFGHPTKEVLEILDQIGAKVLRTDQDGEVVVEW
jgi:competence protein ComEC